jgi:hypothetical protein
MILAGTRIESFKNRTEARTVASFKAMITENALSAFELNIHE